MVSCFPLTRAVLRLGAWGLALLLWPGGNLAAAPHPERGTVRRQLDEILSQREFRGPSRGEPPWLERQLRAFVAWLGSLYDAAPFLFWLLLVSCVVFLASTLFVASRKIRRLFFLDKGRRKRDADTARREELSRTYREEARLRAGRGDFTEAIRYLFLSLVFRFDESGRVLFPRAYTNREYLRLFDDRPDVGPGLRVFVDTLDDHWYGQRPADEGLYRHCLEAYEGLAGRG